jgi:hypothetical protein
MKYIDITSEIGTKFTDEYLAIHATSSQDITHENKLLLEATFGTSQCSYYYKRCD